SMANLGRAAVTQEIETQLSQAVGYASDLLAAQQRQVEQALRLQAFEVARRLAEPAPAPAPALYLASDFEQPASWPPGTELSLDHALSSTNRELQGMAISRAHQSFFVPAAVDQKGAQAAMERLASMDE